LANARWCRADLQFKALSQTAQAARPLTRGHCVV